jgi:imidazolonepropionase-like amidohydrolase
VEVIEADGQWILPGFIDTHAHVMGPRPGLTNRLQSLLDYGVTAARAPAGVTDLSVEVRDAIESGEMAGPLFRVAGVPLDAPGPRTGFRAIVSSEEEARAEVRRQAAAGVDFIKLYTRLSPEIVGAAVDEAHSHDLEVIGHLGRTSWFQALDLGIDALTHSAHFGMASSLVPDDQRDEFVDFFDPNPAFDPSQFGPWVDAIEGGEEIVRELGRRIAEQGVVLDPNLVLVEAVIRGDDPDLWELLVPYPNRGEFIPHPFSAYWSDLERADAQEALSHVFDAVRIFHEEGALITAGTDIGNPWMLPGVSFHHELELLVEAGLSNLDVIVAATHNGAVAIDLLEDLGTVEVGKRGDLVLLSADPLEDIRNTRQIVAVFQNGQRVTSN